MKVFHRFLGVLYPSGCVCPFCGNEALLTEEGLCESCSPLPLIHAPLPCPPALDGLTAGLAYTDVTGNAVKRLKYHGQVWLAPLLSGFLSIPPAWQIDCAVPVPLHWLRKWMRGYNQSELLAKELFKNTPLPVRCDLLKRVRYTTPQARLSHAKRQGNLFGAFAAQPGVKGLSILLIDDVTTTHATLSECAEACRRQGAARVYAACICAAGTETGIDDGIQ